MATIRPTIDAQKRTVSGRKVRFIRRDGQLPGNVFGKGIESVGIAFDQRGFEKLFRKSGETALIDLTIEGEKQTRPVMVSDAQYHPVSSRLIHVNLRQVDLTEKVTAQIPVRLIGEAPVVKDLGAVLITPLSELEVEALPTDFPDHIDVDVSMLSEIGASILVKDLKVDRVKLTILSEEGETVVTVQEPKEEVEEVPPVPAEGEKPAEGEAAAEGEKPAEGEKATAADQNPKEKP